MHRIQLYLQHFHPPPGDSIRHFPVHHPDMPVPDRMLMAGKQLPPVLETVLMHIPVHLRFPRLRQHQLSRCRPRHGRTPDPRARRPDGSLLFPVLHGRISRKPETEKLETEKPEKKRLTTSKKPSAMRMAPPSYLCRKQLYMGFRLPAGKYPVSYYLGCSS